MIQLIRSFYDRVNYNLLYRMTYNFIMIGLIIVNFIIVGLVHCRKCGIPAGRDQLHLPLLG